MTASEADFRFHINGRTYELTLGEVTGTLALEVRKATGISYMEFLQGSLGVDGVAVMVYLARRIKGERVTLEAVLREVSMAAVMDGQDALAEQLAAEEASAKPQGTQDESVVAALVAADPEASGVAS